MLENESGADTMAFGKRKRNRFKFTEKKHSKKGIFATVLGAALVALYFAFVVLAFRSDGTLSMYFGSAGVLAVFGVIFDLVLAAGSLKEENSFPFFPRLALVLALIAAVCWLGTYIMGIVL